MKIHNSLKNVLTINFILITAAPILIIGLAELNILNSYLIEDITEKNFLIANTLAGEVQTLLNQHMTLLTQIAKILNNDCIISNECINNYLEITIKNHDELEMLRILDLKGIVTHIAPFNRNYMGINMSYHPFVQSSIKLHQPQWSSTFISLQTRQPTLALSVPFHEGFIIGYLNLNTLNAIANKIKIGSLGYAFIVDNKGTFIAHPDRSFVEEQLNIKIFPETLQDLTGIKETFIFELKGENVFCSSVIIQNPNWTITVIQPVEEALRPVKRIRNTILIGTVITLILAILIVFIILKKILQPLTKLTEHSQKIAAGEDSYFYHQAGFQEVNELAKNFTSMIDALQLRENQIRKSKNKAQNYLDIAGVILLVINSDKNVTLINRKGCEVLGYSEEEILGKNWFENFVPERRKKGISLIFDRLISGEIKSVEYTEDIILSKNGEERIIAWHNTPIKNDSDEIIGTLSSGEDITERKYMEKNLKNAKKQAEEANQAKTQFLANMSHEIRTPLNAIIGFSQILLEEVNELDLPEYIVEFIEDIINSGQKLSEIIGNILDLSKIEAGKIEIHEEDINIKLLIQGIYHVNKAQASAKNILFSYYIDPELPDIIHSDRTRLNQILMNITNNAIKFTPEGKEVKLEAVKKENNILLQVIDQGIGIPKDQQAKIFEAFEQADSSITKKFGGTGLGLAITKHLAILLGGKIDVESTYGTAETNKNTGSVFSVTIPLKEISSQYNEQKEFSIKNSDFSKDNRILVVEDDINNQKLIRIFFKKLGIEIFLADDGQSAIQKVLDFQKEGHLPNLIIMDMHMPDMSGLETTRIIRSQPDYAEIPIIALSANAFIDSKKEALNYGISDYLTKPVDFNKLINVLNKYLNKDQSGNNYKA